MRIARLIADWLLYCGDPTSRAGPFPPPLPTALAEEELVHRCDLHGILTPLLRRFPFAAARCPRLQAAVKERDRRSQAYSTLLRHLGETVMADAAGLQAAIVKGPVFARALYPSPHLRGFTDIDILAAPEAVPKLETILRAHGFRPAGVPPGPPRHESKWIRDEKHWAMVEVQTNLVHSAAMRRAVSLSYDDISDDPESAPSLLLVALVHSGASHQYERLQHLRDIFFGALALRGARDEQSFKKKLEQTGAWLTAVAGLEFAGKLFGAERCRELANELRPVRHSDLAWHLLGRSLATSTRSDRSMLHSWRRQLFRELIKLRRPGFGRIFE